MLLHDLANGQGLLTILVLFETFHVGRRRSGGSASDVFENPGSAEDGRVHLVANFDRSLEGRVDAVEVIKAAAAEVGGGGGGRATMARAGGKNPEKLDDALLQSAVAMIDRAVFVSQGPAVISL